MSMTSLTASMDHTRLIHKTDSGYTDTKISLTKIMDGREPDTELQSEDVLYSPNNAAESLLYRAAPGIFQSASSAAICGAFY
jgi:hypothetical protein